MFLDLKPLEGWAVAFESISKGKITGISKIGIPSLAFINSVLHVKGLKYNLLSISQFCDNGYIVPFNKDKCIVKIEYDKFFFIIRWHNNLYEINLIDLSKKNVTCFLCREDERWIWHKKLRHVNLKHISKLSKNDLEKGMPKICWKIHLLCETCQQGKQIKQKSLYKQKIDRWKIYVVNYEEHQMKESIQVDADFWLAIRNTKQLQRKMHKKKW